jgi:hypothetical protein
LSKCLALWLAFAPLRSLLGQVNVLTWHNDSARTGQNPIETVLSPVNVNASSFGKLFTIAVDGKVDAQPLYVPSLTVASMGVHNVLYVVTEHDTVYAFDADNGAQLWETTLLKQGESPSDNRGCSQVTPEIGITATPVIDLRSGPHGTLYVVGMSKDGAGNYHHRLHALDLVIGTEEFGGPTEVQATYPGTGDGSTGGTLTFDPKQYKERAALALANGVVYTSWASHCDIFPYTGWVIAYNEATLARVSVLDLTPNGSDGAMWGAGAGLAADSNANLYTLIGNGTFDTTLTSSGFPTNSDYGNAIVKLSTSNSALSVADYFTMHNTTSESNGDEDLGSGGLILLPPLSDSHGNPRALAVGAGKDGVIYVVDRNNLGKFNLSQDAIFQRLPGVIGSVFSSPAWFNGHLYYAAVSDSLKAFAYVGGSFGTTPSSLTIQTFPYPGATPSVSSNGSTNGIIWVTENSSTAVLHAFDASDLSKELYNSNQASGSRDHFGTGNKFITPTIANGKVYVGTTSGVGVFGLLNCTYSIDKSAATFGSNASSGNVVVMTAAGCSWSVSNSSNFVTIESGASGSGPGTVSYSISANPGPSRTASLSIADQIFTLNQSGQPANPSSIGVYHSGVWYLDANSNGQWDGSAIDTMYPQFGLPSDVPVTGDWDGSGKSKIGVYRNGAWYLDTNGNGRWDGPSIDSVYPQFGLPGDIPVVGDWDGSGKTKIGVYRNGTWYLDTNGNGQWDGPGVDTMYPQFGLPTDIPVTGDWDGSGKTKIGVYHNGTWYLDLNGNGQWDGAGADTLYPLFGLATDIPVTGDWDGSGKTKIGVYHGGTWYLDTDGNGQYDASDAVYPVFGLSADIPVVKQKP